MQGWVLMSHKSYEDWCVPRGDLIGSFYSDIESVCREITDDPWVKGHVVNVEYGWNGESALLTTSEGKLFGAFLCKMPMREDMPTKG